MTGARLAIGLAGVLAAALAVGACTQPPSASLSVTPGPAATSSLVPAEEGTPGPSEEPSRPAASGQPSLPSYQASGLPMVSPPHDTASDAPAAS
jgi:hypothetical protein